jgi:hypothetical protein
VCIYIEARESESSEDGGGGGGLEGQSTCPEMFNVHIGNDGSSNVCYPLSLSLLFMFST